MFLDSEFARRFAIALFLFLSLGLNSVVRSQTEPAVLGSLVNQEGNPVAEAKLWLVGGDFGSPELLSETTSDSDGKFAFPDLEDETKAFSNPGMLTVFARHPREGFGFFNGFYRNRRIPFELKLTPSTTFKGQLVDSAGEPISGIEVMPTMVMNSSISESGSDYGQLSPNLSKSMSSVSDAEGRFEVAGAPTSGAIVCDVAMPGFEKLRAFWNVLGDETTVVTTIGKGHPCGGKISYPAGEEFAGSKTELGKVTLDSNELRQSDASATTDPVKAAYRIQASFSAAIAGDGHFKFDSVTPGTYQISTSFAKGIPLYLAGRPPACVVAPDGSSSEIALTAKRAITISGRVVGLLQNEPIPEATVNVMTLVEGGMIPRQRLTTDTDGKFSVFVKQGKYVITVTDAPEGHVATGDHIDSEFAKSRIPRLEVTQDTQWPDLVLDPACDVTLEVFDEHGNPAAGAIVKIATLAGYPDGDSYGTTYKTDANGKYVIRQVTANDTLPIRVRTDTAISDSQLVITPGEQSGPLRVDLKTQGVRFRFRVEDRDGEPIAGAKAIVGASYPFVTKWTDSGLSISGGAGGGVTDTDGYFESGPLWSDQTYWLSATADGYNTTEAPQTRGKLDEVVELKPIVLSKIKTESITGIVTDLDEKPIEGVKVYAAGREWQLAECLSDAAGNFKLENLAADVKFVFADHSKYRLGGTRVGSQTDEVSITLRANESPPVEIRESRPIARSEQLTAAKELIEQAWDLPMSPRNSSRQSLVEAMTEIDMQRAVEMSAQQENVFGYVVRSEQARRAAKTEPDKSIQLLRTINKRSASGIALRLGNQFARSTGEMDEERARKFADLANELTENNDFTFPKLVGLYTAIGDHEKAKLLIKEATDAIDLNSPSDRERSFISRLAVAVAPYDFEKAMAYAGMAGEAYQQTHAQADVALAIVFSDLEKAIATVEGLTGDGNAKTIRDKSRLRIAYLIVKTDPQRAIELAYGCDEPANRSQALGRLAVLVARADQAQAWKMIDDALSVFRHNPEVHSRWTNFGGGGPFAAALAYQAQQVGYPDMESVIWHVRSACRANSAKGQERMSATIKTARILALVDKIAARDLLNSISVNSDQISRDTSYDQWLQAWLLVDFGRGTKMMRDELSEFDQAGEAALRYGYGDVFRLLVAKPEDRFAVLINGTGLWQLEEDGTERN